MKWFKHDSDAHADAKLEKVRIKYGLQGYGLYWYCLELIARSVDKNNLSFELEHDAEIIAFRTGVHRDVIQEMMSFMVDIGLFHSSEGRIFCLKMAYRLDENTQKEQRKLRSDSGVTPELLGTNSALKEEKRTEKKRTEQKERLLKESPAPAARTPHQEIIEIYHRELPELPNVVALNESRRKQIRTHHTGIMESDLANWRGYFQAVRRSDFLMGRKKDWRADFDFLLRTKTPLKVLEGSYS